MRVVGTAGHVDHGKSSLVEALTGIHPDRLKEEVEREMTIDLGFAWLNLPDGQEVGIVDVPGHRDFIENMLAGIGGIDAVVFVVAADEGVMPQTREHLAIIDLLRIPGGVVALTKTDLVDEEWLELVKDELNQVLAGTVLEAAPLVPVSARTGKGIPQLVAAISACLAERPGRLDLGRPRLPIDRVFTIAGFGTVVTGTLSDGCLSLGEEVEILPTGLRGRVRGLQTHKRKEDKAVPGSRTAVNLSGVTREQIQRGNVVAHPGDYTPTRRLDVHFRLLPDASAPLQHNTQVKLFVGAAEVVARLRLLGSEQLDPGQEGWLQLELSQPIVAVRGDRYILRRPSPGETLGGGAVVDPHPKERHKRFSTETLFMLETLAAGTPAEVLLQSLNALGAVPLKDAIARSNLEETAADQAAKELLAQGMMLRLEASEGATSSLPLTEETPIDRSELVASQETWARIAHQATREVRAYHQANPLRTGIRREELKSRLKSLLKGSPRLFNLAISRLVMAGELEESGLLVRRPGFAIRFTSAQEQAVERLMDRFAAAPYAPPSVKECQAEIGEDLFQALLDQDRLVLNSPEVVFRREDYQAMLEELRQMIETQGPVTAAQVRDQFNTSRKYVLAFLEHLDAQGVTVREGDYRRLKDRRPGE